VGPQSSDQQYRGVRVRGGSRTSTALPRQQRPKAAAAAHARRPREPGRSRTHARPAVVDVALEEPLLRQCRLVVGGGGGLGVDAQHKPFLGGGCGGGMMVLGEVGLHDHWVGGWLRREGSAR